jgi:uncharacterized membrane protein
VQRLLTYLLLALLGLGLGLGLAQRSGGGVGGRGGFSRSPINPSPAPSFPSPQPSYPRSYPSQPSYPRYYPSPYGYGGGGGGLGSGGTLTVLLFIGLVFVGFSMVRGLQNAGGGSGPATSVARLRLAVLYSRQLQTALRLGADGADTETTKGLADLIDNTAAAVLREEAAWRFGLYETWKGPIEQAEGQFDQWMTEIRAESVETYRKFDGRVIQNTEYETKAEVDGRYILVTLLLAAHGELPKIGPLRAAEARQAVMALASSTPVTTLAAYVAWTPEASGEALTEQDLLSGWPSLEML